MSDLLWTPQPHIMVSLFGTDPADYQQVIDQLDSKGYVDERLRWELGNKVFKATSMLDANVLAYRLANPPEGTLYELLIQ